MLLEAAPARPACARSLVASSDKARMETRPTCLYRESHPLQGRFPHDCSKSCRPDHHDVRGARSGLRLHRALRQPVHGVATWNFNRLIPVSPEALRERPFPIRSDGKFVRDFLWRMPRRPTSSWRGGGRRPARRRGLQFRPRASPDDAQRSRERVRWRSWGTDLRPVIRTSRRRDSRAIPGCIQGEIGPRLGPENSAWTKACPRRTVCLVQGPLCGTGRYRRLTRRPIERSGRCVSISAICVTTIPGSWPTIACRSAWWPHEGRDGSRGPIRRDRQPDLHYTGKSCSGTDRPGNPPDVLVTMSGTGALNHYFFRRAGPPTRTS